MDKYLTVRLRGALRTPWAYFPPGYHVIGTVYRGMEFGFLAVTGCGTYLRINGSVVETLNRGEVVAAMRNAERLLETRYVEQAVEPVVIVRKSRRLPIIEGAAP